MKTSKINEFEVIFIIEISKYPSEFQEVCLAIVLSKKKKNLW